MVFLVFKNELIGLWRSPRALLFGLGLFMMLAMALWSGSTSQKERLEKQEKAAKTVRQAWDNAGEMNPHGAAHFGTYVFKPAGKLSLLDDGVQAFTGKSLRIEGHVQNETQYADISKQSSLVRMGQFHAALILQLFVPLLLIFLAYDSLSRERETQRLRILLSQGVGKAQLLLGKSLAYWTVALFFVACTGAAAFLFEGSTDALGITVFLASYALYFLFFAFLTVFISGLIKKSTHVLSLLLALWFVMLFLLPKFTAQLAENLYPLPARAEFEADMREDRKKGLDGHNPKGERVEALKAATLEKYGVDSLEQLPVNFDGILMQADEEYGNKVWDKHFGEYFKTLEKQNRFSGGLSLLTPLPALRSLSMAMAGTDMQSHLHFQREAEKYRRVFIKELNDKHAYGGSKTGDWSWKADADFFRAVKDFSYTPLEASELLQNLVFELLALFAWGILLPLLFLFFVQKEFLPFLSL